VPVFGLLKRQRKVYTQIVHNCSCAVLTAILKGKVALGSVIHSDGWKGYSGLVDLGYKKHHRVDHGRNEFVKRKAHINGIENFWGIAKIVTTARPVEPGIVSNVSPRFNRFAFGCEHCGAVGSHADTHSLVGYIVLSDILTAAAEGADKLSRVFVRPAGLDRDPPEQCGQY